MPKQKLVYFVASSVPEDTGGAPIRNYHLLKALAQSRNIRVELFCLCDENRIETLRKQFKSDLRITAHLIPFRRQNAVLKAKALLVDRMQPYMTSYKKAGLGKAVWERCQIEMPDAIHIEQITSYYCLQPYIADFQKQGVKIALDQHNVEADVFEAAITTFSPAKKLVGMQLTSALRKVENQAVIKSDVVFGCSTHDVQIFQKIRGKRPSILLPNGVDCESFTPSKGAKSNTLIFIGKPNYPPNANALRHYAQDIYPRLATKFPDLRLVAIGASQEWVTKNNIDGAGIVPLGFVDDIRPYLAEAVLGICPIREGSGTRIKLLTYMAGGLPIVSTTKGAEGIAYTPGKEIIIADTATTTAAAISDLLTDKKLRDTMSANGRKLVLRQYNWRDIGANLVKEFDAIFAAK